MAAPSTQSTPSTHHPSPPTWLVLLVASTSAAAALAGLLWTGAGEPVPFTTVRGASATLAGAGLYRYDPLFTAAGFRGTDVVTIHLGVAPIRRLRYAPPIERRPRR